MTTKLTLSIDKKTIQRAKRISRQRGKSISKMVEEYLNLMSENESEETVVDKIRKIMKGKIKTKDLDWKKAKSEHLSKKYGI